MRESDLGSLQLPELCDLIKKVEFNPSEGLDKEREEGADLKFGEHIFLLSCTLDTSGQNYI